MYFWVILNISQMTVFAAFYQINSALVSIKDFKKKKKSWLFQTFHIVYIYIHVYI